MDAKTTHCSSFQCQNQDRQRSEIGEEGRGVAHSRVRRAGPRRRRNARGGRPSTAAWAWGPPSVQGSARRGRSAAPHRRELGRQRGGGSGQAGTSLPPPPAAAAAASARTARGQREGPSPSPKSEGSNPRKSPSAFSLPFLAGSCFCRFPLAAIPFSRLLQPCSLFSLS